MRNVSSFVLLAALSFALAAMAGCGNPAGQRSNATAFLPQARIGPHTAYGTPSPAPAHLYVDHNGTLYAYALPLKKTSKPLRALTEDPGSSFAPQIAVDAHGTVAIATNAELRFFKPPIVSFARSAARTILPLTPAMTQIGPTGADLVDIEFDPNGNLWLVSGLGGEISELRTPLNANSVASVVIPFGAAGTKTSGYGAIQARFDVSAALYVYGQAAYGAQLFKVGFPYAKQLSPTGLSVAQADFVDTSQYLPTAPNPQSLILGQYFGSMSSPPPQQPPPPPVDVLAQFPLPLNPLAGLFPDATLHQIAGAVIADPPAQLFFTLDAATGKLSAYPLPLPNKATATLTLRCLAGVAHCNQKPEHLFLAP